LSLLKSFPHFLSVYNFQFVSGGARATMAAGAAIAVGTVTITGATTITGAGMARRPRGTEL
jgi:hypothetical protein